MRPTLKTHSSLRLFLCLNCIEVLPSYLGTRGLFLPGRTVDKESTWYLPCHWVPGNRAWDLILFFYLVHYSIVYLETTLGMFRIWKGVFRSKKTPAGKRLPQVYLIRNLFYKVLELPSHDPFGWTFLSNNTHLILYPHSIISSLITHTHCTFSYLMKNTVLSSLALLQLVYWRIFQS